MSAAAPVLELEDVGVTYTRRNPLTPPTTAVNDCSLKLYPGQLVGLAGPNGAGKTTVLEVSLGSVRATVGRVLWFGEAKRNRRTMRDVGYCPDVPAFPRRLTGREVLRIHAAISGLDAHEAKRRITIDSERLQVDAVLDKRVETLSRGTVQRLAILQSLICRHDILLCDESFAHLDPIGQMLLRDVLRQEALRGAAVLVSSHHLDQLPKFVDRLLIMKGGQVVRSLPRSILQAKRAMVWKETEPGLFVNSAWAKAHPEAWRAGPFIVVPCTDAGPELPLPPLMTAVNSPALEFVGIEEFSLEDLFRDAIL